MEHTCFCQYLAGYPARYSFAPPLYFIPTPLYLPHYDKGQSQAKVKRIIGRKIQARLLLMYTLIFKTPFAALGAKYTWAERRAPSSLNGVNKYGRISDRCKIENGPP